MTESINNNFGSSVRVFLQFLNHRGTEDTEIAQRRRVNIDDTQSPASKQISSMWMTTESANIDTKP